MTRRRLLAALVLAGAGSPAAAAPALWTELPKGRSPAVLTVAALADRARPAVVHVRGQLVDPPGQKPSGSVSMSVGSGFLVEKSGYIITNEHVVRGVAELRVTLYDGREMPGCVVGADEPTDIALLKVEPRGPVPVLPLADSDAVRVGEGAVAIGSPFGFKHSVTAGIVSAKERVIDRGGDDDQPDKIKPYAFFIQTDAAINVGNSGGPLIDAHGAVVGINAAFWGGPQPSQGVSFAIPINIAKVLLPRLRDEGEAPRSYLGVDGQPLTAALSAGLGVTSVRGALIAYVEAGSAAAEAGLEVGDIVTRWDKRPIATDEDLKIYAQVTAPRSRVSVGIVREGKARELVVTTRPASEGRRHPRHPSSCRATPPSDALSLGCDLVESPPARARGLPGGHGVEVARCGGGLGYDAGLRSGDILLRVGRVRLEAVEDFRRALREVKVTAAAQLLLLVRRDGEDFWLALPRPERL